MVSSNDQEIQTSFFLARNEEIVPACWHRMSVLHRKRSQETELVSLTNGQNVKDEIVKNSSSLVVQTISCTVYFRNQLLGKRP